MSTQTSPSALIPDSSKKIVYIDHLKVVLTILVVLHHTFITYGAPGGWYYNQKTTQVGAIIPMTMFVAINQAFFMGFFFFLSACFIPSSYRKKGAARFVTDRLIRLGIPLMFYSFVLSPILSYLVYYFAEEHHINYLQYLRGFDGWIDFGVLWFVAALLLFTLLYVLWKSLAGSYKPKPIAVPKTGSILLIAIGTGVVSFLVRTIFPVGWVLKPVGFQLGHFTQYIALFIFGLIAANNNWLGTLADKTGKQMARMGIVLVILFPAFYIIKIVMNTPLEWYSGGMHWQSLLYAVWEQLIGFSIITALLSYGKKLWNKPSALLQNLSRYAFGVYIFHPLVLISMSLAFRNLAIDPAIKLLFVAPLAVFCSFLLAAVVVRIPGLKKVI